MQSGMLRLNESKDHRKEHQIDYQQDVKKNHPY